MIRMIITIVGMFLLLVFQQGCTNPEVSTRTDVVEGEPATMSVVFRKGDPGEISTRSVNTVDNDIKHVYILVFNAGPGNTLKTLFKATYTGSSLQVSTLSGESIIWAVANVGQNPLIPEGDTFLDDVTSLSDFKEKMAKLGQINPTSGQVLPMSGQTVGSVIIPPGSNPPIIEIPVKRLTAKVALQVVMQLPSTDRMDLLSWEVVNVPGYSFIEAQDRDAVVVRQETSGDSNYFRSPAKTFGLVNLAGGSTLVPGAEFYMYENRKGFAEGYIEQDRARKAPTRSTYINIKARYQNLNEVKNVTYRLYLGENNSTNYDIRRNYRYTYTMTIKGLTEYSTNVEVGKMDSRVVVGDTIFAVDLLEPILDAHYDWRPIRIRALPGYSRVEIIDNGGAVVDVNSSWLKFSLNKTWPTNAEISANSTLAPISHIDLIQHTPVQRSKMIYLYANEMFVNDVPITDIRTLNLRFTYTASTNPANLNIPDSCYTIIRPISQKPALTMGTMGIRPTDMSGNVLPGVGLIFAVERRDEFAMKLGFSAPSATPLTGMRWGFSNMIKQPIGPIAFEYYRTNGLYNTVNLVYKSVSVPYDQTNAADMGTPAYTGAFDAIYNTYAARYAIEKNRDLNGNGFLDENEIKWYLPSRAELILMWVGKKGSNAASNEQMSESYWSSSENGLIGSIDMNFYNGGTGGEILKNFQNHARAVRKMIDPNPGAMKSPYVISGTRKVTGLPAGISAGHPAHVKGKPYPLHGSEEALNTVSPIFEVAKQDCNAAGLAVLSGTAPMYWFQAAGRQDGSWSNITSPATGANAYWEVSPTDPERGVGMWRMPTQRELLTIWMLRKEFLFDGFLPLASGKYWSAPNYYQQSWFTDFTNGYTGVPNPGTEPNPQHYTRCVRDVTP